MARTKKTKLVGRLLFAFALSLVGLALWYYSVVVNVAKPRLIGLIGPTRPSPTMALANNSFSYPSLGIQAPLTNSAQTSPLAVHDWEKIRVALRKGVSVSYTTPDFTNARLAFITGHSSDRYPNPYGAIFAGLGQSSVGDTFRFKLNDIEYSYRVIEKKIMDPNDEAGFKSLEKQDGPERTVLVTCWPVFTTRNRLVIIGERIE